MMASPPARIFCRNGAYPAGGHEHAAGELGVLEHDGEIAPERGLVRALEVCVPVAAPAEHLVRVPLELAPAVVEAEGTGAGHRAVAGHEAAVDRLVGREGARRVVEVVVPRPHGERFEGRHEARVGGRGVVRRLAQEGLVRLDHVGPEEPLRGGRDLDVRVALVRGSTVRSRDHAAREGHRAGGVADLPVEGGTGGAVGVGRGRGLRLVGVGDRVAARSLRSAAAPAALRRGRRVAPGVERKEEDRGQRGDKG